jgi:protein-L-isoaspartate(D-aspartate) O-methyltransferase
MQTDTQQAIQNTQPETAHSDIQSETVRFNMQREQARFNMIEQQIRTWEVLDADVLDLLKQVPREAFVPAKYAGVAFADLEIPIGEGQTMLTPKLEGRILQALEIKSTDRVLEIGTGSGYLTALLAKSAAEVISVEIRAGLSAIAKQRLEQHGIENVILEIGDASNGWAAHAPYDVIVYTGSLPLPPSSAVEQSLAVNGLLFVVIGEGPAMRATLIERISAEDFKHDILFETRLPTLDNALQPERFIF